MIHDAAGLSRFLEATPAVVEPLRLVARLGLPDVWIGAGLLRNAVWDALSGLLPGSNPPGDIDVIWFDALAPEAADMAIEARLHAVRPDLPWSVRNQARMAVRNGDVPYADARDAVAHWPETATAIAARWTGDALEIMAPHGLDDLLACRLRPTPHFAASAAKRAIFAERIRVKRWAARWPGLSVAAELP
ncbi:nucleotidyltransferase family protein [Plastoroseomonas hellenica]|uniref:nucleotidyltransferase family protein n=1 Tax=Plastoroseomonas hellenica TaxID=2687306 RepID=UPI00346207C9